MNEHDVIVFTDGASKGNPGPGGYGAVVVYPKLQEVIELGGLKPRTTNNEMELSAIVAAFSYLVHNSSPVVVYTDSKYAIQGITAWVHGWKRNGWMTKTKTEVANRAIWETLDSLVGSRTTNSITWTLTPSHMGIIGNERADQIASEFAEGKNVKLFRGSLSDYQYQVLDIPSLEEIKKIRDAKREMTKRKTGKAFSYLSVVDGKLERHNDWPSTQKRVSGKNAKYKKTFSKEDENDLIEQWTAGGFIKE